MSELQQMLSALRIGAGRIRAMTAAPGNPGVQQPILDVERVAAWAAALPASNNVWISTSLFGPEDRGTYANVVGINALTLDLDVKDGGMPSTDACRSLIGEVEDVLGRRAAVVVNSGGGIQAHWALEDADATWAPTDVATRERWADLSRRFYALVTGLAREAGGKIDATQGIERVWRAPGTLNTKEGRDPVRATLLRAERVEGMSYDDVDSALRAVGVMAEPAREHSSSVLQVVPADLPAPVQSREAAYTAAAVDGVQNRLRSLTADAGAGWDNEAIKGAFRLVELAESPWCSLTLDGARQALLAAMPTDPGFPTARVLAKFESALSRRSKGRGVPAPAWLMAAVAEAEASTGPEWRRFGWDDFGNAARVIFRTGGTLAWIPSKGTWMRYDGTRWAEDKMGGATATRETLLALMDLEWPLYSDLATPGKNGNPGPSERDDFADWLRKQRMAARLSAATEVMKSHPEIIARSTDFDRHSMLLNVPNGVVNLASGALQPHDPALRLARLGRTRYTPGATSPQWQAFLDRVMPDEEMQRYLQRVVGYTLTGSTKEQAMFVHYGDTANGKSVFLRVLEHVVGEYGQVVPPNTLVIKRMEQHPTDIARMEGRRFLQMSETQEGARLDDALIKRLTGQETITARGMGEDFRDFSITGKIHLVTNHLPHLSGHDSMKRRVRLLHWAVTIPEDERDGHLAERLIDQEAEGVLAWAVRGTQAWLTEGLQPPLVAQVAVAAYFEEEDEVARWMSECAAPADGAVTNYQPLYDSYRFWASTQGISRPMTARVFTQRLTAKNLGARTAKARGYRLVLTPQQATFDIPAGN